MTARLPALLVAALAFAPGVPAAPIPAALVPYDKLDRDQLARIDLALLPDIAVAVGTVEGGAILSCAFSPTGVFAAGTDRGTVVLWDATGAKLKHIGTLAPESAIGGAAPDPAPNTTDAFFRHRADRLAFTPDGKRLAVSLGGTLSIWDVDAKGGKLWDSKKVGSIEALAVSPDGSTVVCGAASGNRFKLGKTKLEPLAGPYPGALFEYTFNKAGDLFASVLFVPERNGPLYGSEVMFWKIDEGKPVAHDLLTLETGIRAVALSQDGKWLATGSLDKKVRLWDLTGKKTTVAATMDAPKWLRKLAFTPDGETLIAFSSGCDLILYDVAKREQRKAWEFVARRGTEFGTGAMFSSFSAMAVAPDGRHVAFSNGTAKAVILRLPGKEEGKAESPSK